MTQLKSVALRVVLYGIGVALGIGFFLLSSVLLSLLFGFPPGYALYNGYFLVIVVWLVVSIALYFQTRNWVRQKRWNLAIFLGGIVTFSLVGGIAVLFKTPQFLVFWPH
jgi:hypothetical protein